MSTKDPTQPYEGLFIRTPSTMTRDRICISGSRLRCLGTKTQHEHIFGTVPGMGGGSAGLPSVLRRLSVV